MSETDAASTTESNDAVEKPNPTESLPDDITKNGTEQGLFRLDAVYESLRYGEYDIKYGVAEFIDNSLDADALNIWTYVEETEKEFDGNEIEVVGQVAVVDDGQGMSKEQLERCLVLGESFSPGTGGDRPIGRFGVGMTMAAISLARRIEVYSRESSDEPFRYAYLDLDEVEQGKMTTPPTAVDKRPPEKYHDRLDGKTGTVVILEKCDRLQHDPAKQDEGIRASKLTEGMETFLGRTYRRFISAGRKFWYNGDKVYLHDPLYMDGPTYFDEKKPGGPEEKADKQGNTIKIPLEVPDSDSDEKLNVEVRISLLPEEWRQDEGSGGTDFAGQRKITENEGISVLRADREVLYGKVPYLIGKKGQSRYKNIDRWWGLEISFPPELDDYFHVRYIKRGAEPVPSVRDKIRQEITNVIENLREEISDHWADEERKRSAEQGAFAEAEDAMSEAESVLPSSQRGSDQSEEETEDAIEQLAEEDQSTEYEDQKENKKEEIRDKPYAIIPVEANPSVFFEPEFLPGKIIIKLNTRHAFYRKVFAPLCGNIAAVEEGEELRQFVKEGDTRQQRLARKALLLLLFSHSKAESMFNDKELDTVFQNLRTWWGTTLGTVLSD